MISLWNWWASGGWQREPDIPQLQRDYHACFNSLPGQAVLRHLLDTVYASVYEGSDPMALAMHNGRRSVVQEILENIRIAEQPNPPEERESDG